MLVVVLQYVQVCTTTSMILGQETLLGQETRICGGSLRTVLPSAPRNTYFLIIHFKNNHVG